MNNFATRMMMTAAAASMAFMPVVAQANTRAGDSATVYSTAKAKPGVGRAAKGEKQAQGFSIVLGLLAASAVIVGGLIAGGVIGNSTDDDQSPGT